MRYVNGKAEDLKIAYIGGGSRGWAWGLMSDLAAADDMSGSVYLVFSGIHTQHGLADSDLADFFIYRKILSENFSS